MKTFRSLCVLLFTALAALGADYAQQSGSAGAASYVTFPGHGLPRLISLDVKGDDAGSVLTVRKFGQPLTILSNALSSVTNLYCATGHGLASNDVVVLQTQAGAARLVVYSGDTNLVEFTTTLGLAATAGRDTVHESEATVTTTIGSATVRLTGECLAIGRPGIPLGLELTGSAAAVINSAVVRYD